MKVSYYPGCTLKTKAQNLEIAAVQAMEVLGVELVELPRWNCCGAVYSLADDDLIHQVAPVRDLVRTHEQGTDKLVTLCSMCYNTLARANLLMRDDEEKRHTINAFMEEEPDYSGGVEVFHLLNFLKREVGFDAIKKRVKAPLAGLKLAPYYGCTLIRPQEVTIEPAYETGLFNQLLEALGATPVDIPTTTDCCGAYQIVGNPDAAIGASQKILRSAADFGADALVVTCPLCEYNLGRGRAAATDHTVDLPTIYFTQLMAIAFGLDPEACRFDLNQPGARQLLERENLMVAQAG